MRMSFSNTNTAVAAVNVLETYGYSATRIGSDVLTDCPALLAVPAVAKRVGLAEIEGVDVCRGTKSIGPDVDAPIAAPSCTTQATVSQIAA